MALSNLANRRNGQGRRRRHRCRCRDIRFRYFRVSSTLLKPYRHWPTCIREADPDNQVFSRFMEFLGTNVDRVFLNLVAISLSPKGYQ
ncbi:MAG: hypothetical protein ACI92G_000154 [Candidatus Pelagisphaera sp.]|jgi:hypothetical protein